MSPRSDFQILAVAPNWLKFAILVPVFASLCFLDFALVGHSRETETEAENAKTREGRASDNEC